ncbi:hypothetical protein [Iningainema tapete]
MQLAISANHLNSSFVLYHGSIHWTITTLTGSEEWNQDIKLFELARIDF